MKKALKILSLVIALIIITCITILLLLGIRIPLNVRNIDIQRERHLNWDSSLNLQQKGNTCSAHSTMAFIYEEKKQKKNPYDIYEKLYNKMSNGYAFPWSITKYLQKNGISTFTYYLGNKSFIEKKKWILEKLDKGFPVILIVGNEQYLHYVIVLGYQDQNFNIYDSSLFEDKNADLEGNISILDKAINNWWTNAVWGNIHINLAISMN